MLQQDQLLNKNASKLAGLHPKLQFIAKQLIEQAYQKGIQVLITQGFRSNDEQAAIYAQGRTKPGKIVSNARPGYSYHNYGLAFDFCLLQPDGTAQWEVNGDWMAVVTIGESLGLEWGGHWTSIKDYPHFQLTFGLTIKDLLSGAKPPVFMPEEPKEEEYMLKIEDAQMLIAIVQNLHKNADTKEMKDKYHYLADEIRKAAGMKVA